MKQTEADKLNELLSLHPQLQAIYETNANAYAWFKMVYAMRCTVEEALIGIAVHQVAENQRLHDLYMERLKQSNTPEKGISS